MEFVPRAVLHIKMEAESRLTPEILVEEYQLQELDEQSGEYLEVIKIFPGVGACERELQSVRISVFE